MDNTVVAFPTPSGSKSRINIHRYLDNGLHDETKFIRFIADPKVYKINDIYRSDVTGLMTYKLDEAIRPAPPKRGGYTFYVGISTNIIPYNSKSILAVGKDELQMLKLTERDVYDKIIPNCIYCSHLLVKDETIEDLPYSNYYCPVCLDDRRIY